MLSQTREDAELRIIINDEIVDGLEYAKVREKICLAKQRAQGLQQFDQGQLEGQRGYDLGEAQRLEGFKNQLADMESEKAQTIADAARQLYQRRVSMV